MSGNQTINPNQNPALVLWTVAVVKHWYSQNYRFGISAASLCKKWLDNVTLGALHRGGGGNGQMTREVATFPAGFRSAGCGQLNPCCSSTNFPQKLSCPTLQRFRLCVGWQRKQQIGIVRQTDNQTKTDIQTEFLFTDRCNQPLIVVTSSAIPLSVPTIGSSHWHQLYLTKSLTMTNTCWLTFIFLLQNTVMHNTHTMSSLDVLFCSGNGQWCIGEMPL